VGVRFHSIICLALSATLSQLPPRVAGAEPVATLSEADISARLDGALELFHAQRGERWTLATDPNERYSGSFGVAFLRDLLARGELALLFRLVDDTFEVELDGNGGARRGPARPIHSGERGGLDGTSCRACHFSGGADGAGTASQLTLLRGDGERLSSAVRRDPPHVMGLGYISLLAQQQQRALDDQVREAREVARSLGAERVVELEAQGVRFGRLRVSPDGALDAREVRGLSPDLKVRPFGWKGRHATLAEVSDEALSVHHGLQSRSYVERVLKRAPEGGLSAATLIGEGPPYDPDQDGVESELGEGQGAALALYLSMLGAPIVRPPESPRLALMWAEGRARFEQVGCAECHRLDLRVRPEPLSLGVPDDDPITVDLAVAGQTPRLHQLDFAPTDDSYAQMGALLLALTDLKRHDMGEGLAEPRAEVLPDGGGEVSGREWLTRPLWGLADTAPYLHDGRALTVEEAILWHGGEAEASRARYEALTPRERGAVRLFLMSLSRTPSLLVE
jgi:hypothetical protein